jgi:hypothetical protein
MKPEEPPRVREAVTVLQVPRGLGNFKVRQPQDRFAGASFCFLLVFLLHDGASCIDAPPV